MDAKKTGNFICESRKKQGMSQKELADKLGITDKAISKWERGVSQS
jgi:transcriptional regulator with XRE-family HTH domain